MTRKSSFLFLAIFLALISISFPLSRLFYKPKVFDCFLFFNEFDVLDIRLNELSNKVDKFILVESTRGFLNTEKPLYFLQNKERYAKFKDKIVHVVVDQFPQFGPVKETDYWEVENFQRNQILKGLKRCKPNKRDIILITDVDEIIRNEKIDQIIKLIDKKHNDVVFGEFECYKFFINRKQSDNLHLSIATSWETLSKYIGSAQSFRNLNGFAKGHAFNGFEVLEAVAKKYPKKRWKFARIQNLGWHFTSLGDFSHYLKKIASYSHVGTNNEHNRRLENIQREVSALQWRQIDTTFPKYVLANRDAPDIEKLIDQKETRFH